MAAATKLLTSGGGGVILTPASSIASDVTVSIPSVTGTAGIIQNNIITSATAVASTSGTSIDFTGIPTGVKRVTVMFNAVSTSGTSLPQIQLGTSGGVETTGYVSLVTANNSAISANSTTGILVNAAGDPGYVVTGIVTIATLSSNLWVSSIVTTTDSSSGNYSTTGAGRKTLSGTLARVRLTTVGGTDTFDAGSINILYE